MTNEEITKTLLRRSATLYIQGCLADEEGTQTTAWERYLDVCGLSYDFGANEEFIDAREKLEKLLTAKSGKKDDKVLARFLKHATFAIARKASPMADESERNVHMGAYYAFMLAASDIGREDEFNEAMEKIKEILGL